MFNVRTHKALQNVRFDKVKVKIGSGLGLWIELPQKFFDFINGFDWMVFARICSTFSQFSYIENQTRFAARQATN